MSGKGFRTERQNSNSLNGNSGRKNKNKLNRIVNKSNFDLSQNIGGTSISQIGKKNNNYLEETFGFDY